jgi:DNA-binding transcriptional regulator YdaS (Cro superfamily)
MNQTNIIESLGGPTRVAKLLGITVAAVSAWRGIIPPRRAIQLAAITGRSVSELHPDPFRRDGDAA